MSGLALRYDNFMKPYKGNMAFNLNPKLEEYKKKYFDKFVKDILVSCVHNEKYDRWTFFFKLPSEENEKYPTALMYDIVIEFRPSQAIKKHSKTLGDLSQYDIYVFSNSPGFVFTFDYVIKHKFGGFPLCIPSNYLSKIAVTKAPVIRNTFELMTIEKTTWICFFHLVHNDYLVKNVCNKILSTKPESFYVRAMATQPQKLKEIKDLHNVLKEERMKERARKNGESRNYTKGGNDEKTESSFLQNFKENFSMKNNKIVQKIGKMNNKVKFKNMFKAKF
jgi:hypothetical protein